MGNFDKKIDIFLESLIEHGAYNKVLEGLRNTLIIAIMGLVIGIVIGTVKYAIIETIDVYFDNNFA